MTETIVSRDVDPLSVRALTRGLSILGLYDEDHREWTIDEMTEQTGLVRMTVYRMARTLESMAFLVRDTSTNRYRLGPAALAMCYVADDQSAFVEAARPYLEALVKETGESVTLAVEVDSYPVCVAMIDTTRPFKRQTAPGRILGDFATVHGKIFAAFKSLAERKAILAKPRSRTTPNTLTDMDKITAEFDEIVAQDVAYDMEGSYPGLCSVGAPVRDQFGTVTATIGVVMPAGRFGPAERDLCTQAVKKAAAAFSAYLGWTPRITT